MSGAEQGGMEEATLVTPGTESFEIEKEPDAGEKARPHSHWKLVLVGLIAAAILTSATLSLCETEAIFQINNIVPPGVAMDDALLDDAPRDDVPYRPVPPGTTRCVNYAFTPDRDGGVDSNFVANCAEEAPAWPQRAPFLFHGYDPAYVQPANSTCDMGTGPGVAPHPRWVPDDPRDFLDDGDGWVGAPADVRAEMSSGGRRPNGDATIRTASCKHWHIALASTVSPVGYVADNAVPILTGDSIPADVAGDPRNPWLLADPFAIFYEPAGTWTLFFEVFDNGIVNPSKSGRRDGENRSLLGRLAWAQPSDADIFKPWRFGGFVTLEGTYKWDHASYPQVFEHDGYVYMLPFKSLEPLRLFRASKEEFPSVFRPVGYEIAPQGMMDANLVSWKGDWYVMGLASNKRDFMVYTTPNLNSTWRVVDGSGAWDQGGRRHNYTSVQFQYLRGAGMAVRYKGNIVHPGQPYNDRETVRQPPYYGYGPEVAPHLLLELSPSGFRWAPFLISPVYPDAPYYSLAMLTRATTKPQRPFFNDGVHTVSSYKLRDGEWLTFLDALDCREAFSCL